MRPTLLCDIDDILSPFNDAWHPLLLALDPAIPHPALWRRWAQGGETLDPAVFFASIRAVHDRQLELEPLPGALELLQTVRDADWRILIASNRQRETYEVTWRWLERHGLPYDDLHVTPDKRPLLRTVQYVIDDGTPNLELAIALGIPCAGLAYGYNRQVPCPLFPDLATLTAHVSLTLTGRRPLPALAGLPGPGPAPISA